MVIFLYDIKKNIIDQIILGNILMSRSFLFLYFNFIYTII